MDRQRKAYAYGLATVLLWSTVASAFKLSLRHLTHVELLLFSVLTSVAVLGLILIIQGNFRLLLTASRRDWLLAAGLGFLNPFLYYLILFKAYALLPAQEAQPLNYTWAVALVLLSIPMLHQRITGMDIAAILVSYLGVVVISTHGDLLGLHFSNPFGVALALASTVIWALYWIFNTRDRRDPTLGLFMNFLAGLIYITIYYLLFAEHRSLPLPGLAGAAYVGTFEMGITFVLWLQALKLSRTTAQVGNLIFLSPFISLILIQFFVGEKILVSTIIGLALIIAGLLIRQYGQPRPAPEPE